MMSLTIFILSIAATVGSGLIAGIFFAFSSFVMGSLSTRPAAESIATMQAINVKVLNVSFLGTFFGTTLVCLALAVLTLLRMDEPGTVARLIGCGLYVVGTFGVTILFNVPRNDALADVEPTGPDAEATWQKYDKEWTAWNTVRTLAALGSMAAFLSSLC